MPIQFDLNFWDIYRHLCSGMPQALNLAMKVASNWRLRNLKWPGVRWRRKLQQFLAWGFGVGSSLARWYPSSQAPLRKGIMDFPSSMIDLLGESGVVQASWKTYENPHDHQIWWFLLAHENAQIGSSMIIIHLDVHQPLPPPERRDPLIKNLSIKTHLASFHFNNFFNKNFNTTF